MSKWYGSLNNRVEENKMFCETIEVGTGVTEYSWSDRHPYEVVAVKDQKNVAIRRMKHERPSDEGDYSYTNKWVLTSDEEAPEMWVTRRGNYWYIKVQITPEEAKEILEGDDIDAKLWACHNGFNLQEVIDSQKTKTKLHRTNLSFGKAEYYYDYEF